MTDIKELQVEAPLPAMPRPVYAVYVRTGLVDVGDYFTAAQMREYVLADRRQRAAGAVPLDDAREVLQQAARLCEWIAESPHQRGSINGAAAQLGYAISSRITPKPAPKESP